MLFMALSIRKSRLGPCKRLNAHPGGASAPYDGAVLSCRIQTPQPGGTMNLTTEHLADLLIGITRMQNFLIEALEHANPGFRNTHALPLLNIAANTRAGGGRCESRRARFQREALICPGRLNSEPIVR